MGISIDHKSKKVLIEIDNMDSNLKKNLRRGLYFVGKKLRQTASDNILKRGRSGRVYKYKGRRHVASSPGESWANRSGEARRGLIYSVQGSDQLTFGNKAPHAEYLEFGTKNMAARPAHLISINENNRNIINILDENILKAIN